MRSVRLFVVALLVLSVVGSVVVLLSIMFVIIDGFHKMFDWAMVVSTLLMWLVMRLILGLVNGLMNGLMNGLINRLMVVRAGMSKCTEVSITFSFLGSFQDFFLARNFSDILGRSLSFKLFGKFMQVFLVFNNDIILFFLGILVLFLIIKDFAIIGVVGSVEALDLALIADILVDRVMNVESVIYDRGGLVLTEDQNGWSVLNVEVGSVLSHPLLTLIGLVINITELEGTSSEVLSRGDGLVIVEKFFARATSFGDNGNNPEVFVIAKDGIMSINGDLEEIVPRLGSSLQVNDESVLINLFGVKATLLGKLGTHGNIWAVNFRSIDAVWLGSLILRAVRDVWALWVVLRTLILRTIGALLLRDIRALKIGAVRTSMLRSFVLRAVRNTWALVLRTIRSVAFWALWRAIFWAVWALELIRVRAVILGTIRTWVADLMVVGLLALELMRLNLRSSIALGASILLFLLLLVRSTLITFRLRAAWALILNTVGTLVRWAIGTLVLRNWLSVTLIASRTLILGTSLTILLWARLTHVLRDLGAVLTVVTTFIAFIDGSLIVRALVTGNVRALILRVTCESCGSNDSQGCDKARLHGYYFLIFKSRSEHN